MGLRPVPLLRKPTTMHISDLLQPSLTHTSLLSTSALHLRRAAISQSATISVSSATISGSAIGGLTKLSSPFSTQVTIEQSDLVQLLAFAAERITLIDSAVAEGVELRAYAALPELPRGRQGSGDGNKKIKHGQTVANISVIRAELGEATVVGGAEAKVLNTLAGSFQLRSIENLKLVTVAVRSSLTITSCSSVSLQSVQADTVILKGCRSIEMEGCDIQEVRIQNCGRVTATACEIGKCLARDTEDVDLDIDCKVGLIEILAGEEWWRQDSSGSEDEMEGDGGVELGVGVKTDGGKGDVLGEVALTDEDTDEDEAAPLKHRRRRSISAPQLQLPVGLFEFLEDWE